MKDLTDQQFMEQTENSKNKKWIIIAVITVIYVVSVVGAYGYGLKNAGTKNIATPQEGWVPANQDKFYACNFDYECMHAPGFCQGIGINKKYEDEYLTYWNDIKDTPRKDTISCIAAFPQNIIDCYNNKCRYR